MKHYKFLIFDLDDTILDFQDTEKKALKIIFQKYNIPFEKNTISSYKAINKRLWNQLEKCEIEKKDIFSQRFEQFFKLYGYEVNGDIVEKEYRSCLNVGHKLISGAFECLTILKRSNYKILAGTNGVGTTQRICLRDSQIHCFFDDIFISEEIGVEKPSSDFFTPIFKKYPYMTKEQTLLIGDSLSSDILGANNFGIDSVWYNPSMKDKSNIKPTYEIKDFTELLLILETKGDTHE